MPTTWRARSNATAFLVMLMVVVVLAQVIRLPLRLWTNLSSDAVFWIGYLPAVVIGFGVYRAIAPPHDEQ